MKLVNLTATDVEKLKKALPKGKAAAPALHHEELTVDGVSIGLARPAKSEDPRTNTYSIAFRCDNSDYQIIVRPTVHETPSVTLNIIRKETGNAGTAQFASYSVLKDIVTTAKGVASGVCSSQAEGTTSEAAPASFDFKELLDRLKMQ